MKEIKDFIKELQECAEQEYKVVSLEDAIKIVSEAFIAGMNFQSEEHKKQSTTQY